jgi:hypothetical protein
MAATTGGGAPGRPRTLAAPTGWAARSLGSRWWFPGEEIADFPEQDVVAQE